MKSLMLIITALFTFQAFAQMTKTCQSVHPGLPSVEITFVDRYGFVLDEVSMMGSSMFKVDLEEHDAVVYFDVKSEIQNFPLAVSLQNSALGLTEYHSAQATLITSLNTDPRTLIEGTTFAEQMETISDDASGVAYFEFLDENNNVLGSSILVGWGGIFRNCQPAKN